MPELTKESQSKRAVLKHSTLHRDLHLNLGPFAWTSIWADFHEAGFFTFLPERYGGPEKQERLMLLSLKLEGVKVHHSLTHLQNLVMDSEPITRTPGAWWEYTLDGRSIHPSITRDHAHINFVVKNFLIVHFQSWNLCALPAGGDPERSGAEPLWERRVGEWGRLSHGHCRNFPTIKQINRVLRGAVSGPRYTGGGLLRS